MQLNLDKYLVPTIMDSFPEGWVYLKDSGLWMIQDEDEDILFDQRTNESFEGFIRRVGQILVTEKGGKLEPTSDRNIFLYNLAANT